MFRRSDKGTGQGKEIGVAVAQGVTAFLSLGKESTDGLPLLKGALGSMVWIIETCQVRNQKPIASVAKRKSNTIFAAI